MDLSMQHPDFCLHFIRFVSLVNQQRGGRRKISANSEHRNELQNFELRTGLVLFPLVMGWVNKENLISLCCRQTFQKINIISYGS